MQSLGSARRKATWCTGGVLLARLLRTDRQWRLVNTALGLLLVASVVPIWLSG